MRSEEATDVLSVEGREVRVTHAAKLYFSKQARLSKLDIVRCYLSVAPGALDHPDELSVDLDPGPGVSWADLRTVALEVRSLLEEMGLRGWPKTSGSRGMHVNGRIPPR